MSSCSSCGAPIVWAVTVKGRRLPLDPASVADGNLARRGGLVKGHLIVEYVRPGELHTDPLRFVSHFATCPHAAQHRKPRP